MAIKVVWKRFTDKQAGVKWPDVNSRLSVVNKSLRLSEKTNALWLTLDCCFSALMAPEKCLQPLAAPRDGRWRTNTCATNRVMRNLVFVLLGRIFRVVEAHCVSLAGLQTSYMCSPYRLPAVETGRSRLVGPCRQSEPSQGKGRCILTNCPCLRVCANIPSSKPSWVWN